MFILYDQELKDGLTPLLLLCIFFHHNNVLFILKFDLQAAQISRRGNCDGIADATLLVAVINHSIISYSNYPLIPNEETTLYMNIIINLYFSWSMSYNYLIMMV